jgi:diguanylate cyclase (GGDEF)-like protein/PAS domain S-box-containing protein
METKTDKTVLLVGNDLEETYLIYEMLGDSISRVFDVTHVESASEAGRYLAQQSVDILLMDLGVTAPPGLEAVRQVRAAAPRASIVLLVCPDNEQIAVQAIEEGVQDYLIKGHIEKRALIRTIFNAAARTLFQEALFMERQRAQAVLDCIDDAVICTNKLGDITFLNSVAERIAGSRLTDAVGRPMGKAFRLMDATTRRSIVEPMTIATSGNWSDNLRSNCVLIRGDGYEVFVENSVAPIRDREGAVAGAVIVMRDVTGMRILEEKLRHSLGYDFLTSLPNRMLFKDRVDQAIALARRNMNCVAVLFLDLDAFKHINDSLGHLIGDKLLQSVAMRLADCVRGIDTVSRLGGDEFVVLLQNTRRTEYGGTAAARLLSTIADLHLIEQHKITITASIGVSVYPLDGKDADSLIKKAVTAMYRAKKKGGKRYEFFKPDMLLDPVEDRSNEPTPIVGEESDVFTFKTKIVSLLRREKPL